MKNLTILITCAIAANLLTFVLYENAAGQPGGTGAALVFSILWMPLIWLTCLIVTTVITIHARKILFKRLILKWTIPVLLFCTPIPMNILYLILHYSTTYLASTGYNPRNGVTVKDEEWCYTKNQKIAVHKFFKLDSEDYSSADDASFKKDSTWVYLSVNGDTTRIERYSNGILLSATQKSK